SCPPAALASLERLAAEHAVGCWELGRTGGERLELAGPGWRLDLSLQTMAAGWRQALPRALEEPLEEPLEPALAEAAR
ncbi:MAG: hypothetical protein ACRD13_08240, partial [Terriglobales bacterium]